ncbi:hypothetical protein [Litorihabitans aurantiacus]|uniref:Head-to-tail adaptor n=1 Tax=Litorihabitans aurantiacus TaxID=1930061 RepID=A0AA38CSN9_9MICO|nr:hypothetical protein [Litorihabitans aurantiacus]GMA33638.1 hypothetical protein GCM10025875_36300 [Litorihabitans aurantiacus]
MTTPYATVEDLRDVWPALSSDAAQVTRAQALLRDATARIDAYGPAERLVPTGPGVATSTRSEADLAIRRMICREMVLNVLANDGTPGVTNETSSRSLGPFSESRTFTFDAPGRTLTLTREHKRLLRPRRQRAYSVSLYPRPVNRRGRP